MDDTFSFSAPAVPLRRRTDPRAVKLALVGLVLMIGLVVFARWVIESERRSEAKAAAASSGEHSVGLLQGTETVEPTEQATLSAIDVPARADARSALAAAREAARGRASLAGADPGRLSAIDRSLIFTDGPSPAPGIVSVAIDGHSWAAAVMGASGDCYWAKLGPAGVSYGTGSLCTGTAALTADVSTWSSPAVPGSDTALG
jgi:hypothetical protein